MSRLLFVSKSKKAVIVLNKLAYIRTGHFEQVGIEGFCNEAIVKGGCV